MGVDSREASRCGRQFCGTRFPDYLMLGKREQLRDADLWIVLQRLLLGVVQSELRRSWWRCLRDE